MPRTRPTSFIGRGAGTDARVARSCIDAPAPNAGAACTAPASSNAAEPRTMRARTKSAYGKPDGRSENRPSVVGRRIATLRCPMGELGAFLKIHRVGFQKRDPNE